MSQKFKRNYRVVIDPKDGKPPILVTMPFTIRFWIERIALSDMNSLSLDIYNLSETNRARIYQDPYNYGTDPSVPSDTIPGRTISIEMGYETLYEVFSGVIQQASSAREGVDIVTRIEAWDNKFDMNASQTFVTLDSQVSVSSILSALIGQFSTLKQGAVGNFPKLLPQSVTLNGATWDLLKTYSNDNVYIDQGKIYCLHDNEYIGETTYKISESSGILGTPRRAQGYLEVEMLLETGIQMFGLCVLDSTVSKFFNQQNTLYKVIGITHEGTISAAVNGRAITRLKLQANQIISPFVKVDSQ